MIKNIILFLIVIGSTSVQLKAQDSSAYETQRAKINALLAERSSKFGQYDQSLTARTGIFGFQTKKDIKNSNEILRQIAINDNAIFTELKVLMDYKDLQVAEVKTAVNSNAESIQNYRRTIKQLQDQNQKLNDDFDKAERSSSTAHIFMFLFLIGIIVLAYFLNKKHQLLRHYEKANV